MLVPNSEPIVVWILDLSWGFTANILFQPYEGRFETCMSKGLQYLKYLPFSTLESKESENQIKRQSCLASKEMLKSSSV